VRILLLSNLYPPYVQGGAEILAGDVAAGLEGLGHEILVLTSSEGLSQAQQEGKVWRTLSSAPPAHFDRRRPPWQQFDLLLNYYHRYHCPSNATELRRVVKATRPDVLYVWEITGVGVISLLSALPEVNLPVVFHLGSYWLLYAQSPETEQSRLRLHRLKQWLIGSLPPLHWTSFIAVSATVKQKYAQAGFDPERIEVIYNGIDDRFLTLPPTDHSREKIQGDIQLLFVGRLRVEKGLLVLLKALDLLLRERSQGDGAVPPLHLNIFGTGDQVYVDELHAFLREKDLAQFVTFHGRISQDELIGYYDRSHLILVPSLWQEPFGLVIAEAMARGLPVIASQVGGPAEILTHGVDGLLVKPGDEGALAIAIRQLLENPEKRKQLGQAGQTTVRARFTIGENAKRVEQHLLRAIQ
jgi:glycosyltransferase involved in cell wall biosynthesis